MRRDYTLRKSFCYNASMMKSELIERVLAAIRTAVPADAVHDVEKNARAGLDALLSRMDLVTREEFEVQQAVLARTRALLEKLEAQVAALERTRKGS